jgi:phospholipase C
MRWAVLIGLVARVALAAPEDFPVSHVVVVYTEGASFDALLGGLPGANGLDAPGAAVPQVDRNGRPYEDLPRPVPNLAEAALVEGPPRWQLPLRMPAALFSLDDHVPEDAIVRTPQEGFYQQRLQIAGGRMNGFVAWTDTGPLPLGHWETTRLGLASYARLYTVADAFFAAAYGGAFLNATWLACACTPVWENAPANVVAAPAVDAAGQTIGIERARLVAPDGRLVNAPDAQRRPPLQTAPTIADRLTDKGIDWAWYAGTAGDAVPSDPLALFARWAPGSAERAAHVRPEAAFVTDVTAGRMPAVAFVSPAIDAPPGFGRPHETDRRVVDLIELVKASPHWDESVVIVTAAGTGGWYDHVPPPAGDAWGPGGRVPAMLISPHARKGFVDHTPYDTTSILRFLEWRFDLEPLGARDAAAANLLAAFEPPRPPVVEEPPLAD